MTDDPVDSRDDVGASMRETYMRCSTAVVGPNALIMPGSSLNTLNETTIYEHNALYLVTTGTISKIED